MSLTQWRETVRCLLQPMGGRGRRERRPGFRPRLEALEDRLVLSPPGGGWELLFEDNFNGTALNTGTGPERV